MLTRIISLCIFLLAINIAYGNKIGLDSGHSIKELYKSGGSFNVDVEEWDPKQNKYVVVPKPYFSIGWPAGGVNILSGDGLSALNMGDMADKIGARRSYAVMVDSISFPNWQDYGKRNPINFKTALQKIGRNVSDVSSDNSFIAGFQDVRTLKGISIFQGSVKGITFSFEVDFGQDKYKDILEDLRKEIEKDEGKEMKTGDFSKSMLGEEIKFKDSCTFKRKYKNLKVFISKDGNVRYRPIEYIIEDSEEFPVPYRVGIVYLRQEKSESGWVEKDGDLVKSKKRGAVYNNITSSGILNNIMGKEAYFRFWFKPIRLGNPVVFENKLENVDEIMWSGFEVDDKEKVIYSTEYIRKGKNGEYFRIRTDCGRYFYSWIKITKVTLDANGNITSEVDVLNMEREDDLVSGHPDVNETDYEARAGQLEYRLNWDIANKVAELFGRDNVAWLRGSGI